ncbi:MAG TPA: amidase domain-containing protein [Bacillota bacterium]|nr:amidase domain-containing protein [Bacillota bacterium]
MEILKQYWLDFLGEMRDEENWWKRKQKLWESRDGKIVQMKGKGRIYEKYVFRNEEKYQYHLHLRFLIKQKDRFHLEEQIIPYELRIVNGKVKEHKEVRRRSMPDGGKLSFEIEAGTGERFTYNRLQAVQYAERWWNSYNPAYRKFEVDCTNFVSQCLRAGGAPMRGAPVRSRGWWYSGDSWSYSWAVAHSLRWYLSGSTVGLTGTEVERPEELEPGDVICYDFSGDGRWDHNTIVVSKDYYGMPLVNAHTDNSRHRYWSYEDSTAYTPDIQYKFFRIG